MGRRTAVRLRIGSHSQSRSVVWTDAETSIAIRYYRIPIRRAVTTRVIRYRAPPPRAPSSSTSRVKGGHRGEYHNDMVVIPISASPTGDTLCVNRYDFLSIEIWRAKCHKYTCYSGQKLTVGISLSRHDSIRQYRKQGIVTIRRTRGRAESVSERVSSLDPSFSTDAGERRVRIVDSLFGVRHGPLSRIPTFRGFERTFAPLRILTISTDPYVSRYT